MDEKLLEQLSQNSGIPKMLLGRSVQARAEATGKSSDEILSSWSGGETIIQPSSSSVVKNEPVQKIKEEKPAIIITEERNLITEAEPSSKITQTVKAIEENFEPPVSINEKITKSLKFGLGFGLVAGLIQGLINSSLLFDGLVLEAETQNLIAEYNLITFVLVISLTSSFFGSINAVNTKKYLDSNYLGFGIFTTDRESVLTGGGLGLIFGSITAFFIVGSVGQSIAGYLPDDPVVTLISVGNAFWRIVVLSIISQSAISALSMLLGVPKGLEIIENLEADKIRKRIIGSLLVPFGSILFGGSIAFLIAQIFFNFHEYAPLFALIIAASILLFASVMSSAPKIKITKAEVFIASAGILTLIIIIASIALSQH